MIQRDASIFLNGYKNRITIRKHGPVGDEFVRLGNKIRNLRRLIRWSLPKLLRFLISSGPREDITEVIAVFDTGPKAHFQNGCYFISRGNCSCGYDAKAEGNMGAYP